MMNKFIDPWISCMQITYYKEERKMAREKDLLDKQED